MRNKRTLQRGLSLLLAGGMALSSVGVTPVLAEEYTPAPETVQATPETAVEETDGDTLTADDLIPAEESTATEDVATQQADETTPIAVQAAEEEMTQLISEDFSNCTDNFGFSSKAAVQDEALVLTNDSTGSATVKKFDNVVASQSKVHLNFDWKTNHTGRQGKAGIEFRDTYGRLLFTIASAYKNGSYQLRYGTSAPDSTFTNVGNSANDATWVIPANVTLNQYYNVDLTADFAAGTLHITITDPNGEKIVDEDRTTTAKNLAQMARCDYYTESWAHVIFTVDNFNLYGSNDAGEFPLEGKSIVAFGDSIVAGHKYETASFVDFVAQKEGMNVQKKYAINGASIMEYNSYGGMILTKQIENADASLAPDYVIFDGGTNDAEYLVNNQDKFGDKDSTDTTTFAGAFRATIQALKEKYPSAKLVYVAVHKLGARDADVQAKLHELELAICEDMGVNVSNIYDDTTLDTSDADMKAKYSFDSLSNAGVPQSGTDGAGTNATGTHPNFKAIEEFYVPTVSATLRTAKDTPAEPDEPEVKVGASIDFADVASLNDDLNGWTYTNGGGTTELVTDAEMGQVLKMSRTSDGGETALIYDGLNITESDTRYVTVTAEMKLDKDGYAHQYSIPYIFNNSGAVAYSLFTNDSATKYQAHVNGKNTTDAGTLTTDTWQTVRMDIDMQSDTFSVSVDGVTTLRNVKARTATDNLQKIKFYADSWNRGTLYIKSVAVTASNEDPSPIKKHETAATYYVSNSGNDSNDGLSEETAWKTIARVNQDAYIPGDEILFERGGKWENTTLQPQGSGTADAYIKIGAYGDATARPKIAANGKVADALYLYNQEYWEICDLDISNNVEGTKMVAGDTNPTGNVTDRNNDEGSKLGDYRGIHIAGHDVATLQGYYIHDVRVHDVSGYVSWIGSTGLEAKGEKGIKDGLGYDGSKRTGGILIEAIAPTGSTDVKTGQPTVFSDIRIEDSEFVNNSFCGITIKQYNNGKNQENGTGWANRNSNNGAPDYYDQYWHPFTNIVIRNNYINQGASAYACNGMYLCGVKDSVVEKNLLENIGTCGIELFFADNVAVQYNDISNVRWKGGGQDANAIDPDWRATNILIQYNYIHDCGEGFLLCGMRCNSGTIRYNLVQDCTSSYIHYSMGSGYFQISNNVFYRSKDGNGTSNFDPWGGGTASYVNNIFYDGKGTGFGFSGGSSFSYYNNAYYGTAACSKDTNPIILTEDPFEKTAPAMSRVGTPSTGVLLEANGLIPKTSSGLVAAGADKDANGFALTEGMTGKGTKLNYTSLIAAYGEIVPIAATAYPVFEETGAEATLATKYTQTVADTTAPTIGLFEVTMPEDAVYLRGTVSDDVNACANAKVTVTVNGKTVETTTNDSGVFSITEGLTVGEATVTVVVEGRDTYTKTITLEGGKVNTVEITVPMPAMPDAYSDTLISETFDEDAGALTFSTNATVADGRLALSPGNAASSYADFDEDVQSRTAVDFSFDFQYQNGSNKGGFQFRDSEGHLLFAMCIKTADGGNTMRTAAAESLVGGTEMSEPKWVDHTADYNKTYVVRVHADFEAGTVSYQLKDKATDKVVLQELNIPTNATNLARMYSSNWYQAKTQYIDNFVLTAAAKKPEPIEVDKSKLVETISESEKKAETDYTAESWKDFSDALKAAKDVLAKDDVTQAEVDAATEALTKAAEKLETKPAPVVVNKEALQQAISEGKKKVETDYTAESWKPFAEALAAAQDVLANSDATQDEVNAAAVALTKAAAALKVKPTEPPKTETVTKVDNEPLSDKNIPDSLKEAGYDTPKKIEDELKQESSKEFASDNLVVYDVTLKVSTDGGKTWQKATDENFPKDGLEVSFDLPEGITAETANQYTFLISHMKDDATVELLTPVLKDGKLTVTVKSLSPFGISWKAKEQPQPSEQPTATPAPTAKPGNSSTTPKATAAPKATDAPKATAAPAAPIPQTADSFPLVMLAVLALCSAAALAGLTICRSKKKH